MREELFDRLTHTAAGLALLLGLGLLIAIAVATWHTIRRLSRPPRRSYAWAVAKGLPGDPAELDDAPLVARAETIDAHSGAGSRTGVLADIQTGVQTGMQTSPPYRHPAGGYTEWTFRSRGMDLPVWDITGEDKAAPVLIFTHGWGESRITSLHRVQTLRKLFSRIILWDMPGHGDAPGTCTLGAHEPEDLASLLAAISVDVSNDASEGHGDSDDGTESPAASAEPSTQATPSASADSRRAGTPVVLMGFSLGAGVSIAAAANTSTATRASTAHVPSNAGNNSPLKRLGRTAAESIVGVIAEAPYRVPITPARAVLSAGAMPWRVNLPIAMAWLGWRAGHGLSWARSSTATRFDRAQHAKALRVPLLVIHGQDDAICPPTDGQAIAQAAMNGTYTPINNASHLDIWHQRETKEQALQAITAFIAQMKSD